MNLYFCLFSKVLITQYFSGHMSVGIPPLLPDYCQSNGKTQSF